MKLTSGRSIKYFFLTHLVFFIAIALFCLIFAENLSVKVLVPPYLLITILIWYSRLFLPISVGAIFMLIILADKNAGSSSGSEENSGTVLITSAIPVAIPSALIYFMLIFFTEPALTEKKEWFEDLSKAGSYYLEQAQKNLENSNLDEALAFADLYLYIDPDNKTAIDIKNDVKIALPDSFPDLAKTDDTYALPGGEEITGSRLLEAAQSYYEKGDYSSAAYYAQTAGGFRGSRQQAVSIIEKSFKKLSELNPVPSATEKLYDGKITILNLIEAGDLPESYYKYHFLFEEFPDDPELKLIGERIFSLLESTSFFYEDARKLYYAPGKSEIAFINYDNSQKQLIFADKIIYSGKSAYFFNIDIIEISETGTIQRHLKSLYGQATDNILNLQIIGKEQRFLLLPEIITGPLFPRISSINLSVPQHLLLYMGFENSRYLKLKTDMLISDLDILIKSGAGTISPAKALFLRFVRFFNYIFMLLIVMAAGVSFLKRRSKKSYLSFLILPVIVVFIYCLEIIIIWLKSRIITIFISETGIIVSAICCSLMILAELTIVFVYTVIKAKAVSEYKA